MVNPFSEVICEVIFIKGLLPFPSAIAKLHENNKPVAIVFTMIFNMVKNVSVSKQSSLPEPLNKQFIGIKVYLEDESYD